MVVISDRVNLVGYCHFVHVSGVTAQHISRISEYHFRFLSDAQSEYMAERAVILSFF